jgi:hypothetical protein
MHLTASAEFCISHLVVTLLDGGGEVTISWHHEQAHIGLGGTGNHVLDEVTVTWGVNDCVVVLLCEELLGGAGDGHTTSTLLLLQDTSNSGMTWGLSKRACMLASTQPSSISTVSCWSTDGKAKG